MEKDRYVRALDDADTRQTEMEKLARTRIDQALERLHDAKLVLVDKARNERTLNSAAVDVRAAMSMLATALEALGGAAVLADVTGAVRPRA